MSLLHEFLAELAFALLEFIVDFVRPKKKTPPVGFTLPLAIFDPTSRVRYNPC